MALITRCCCFNNVRSGSYASGVYTMVYAVLGFIYFALLIIQYAYQPESVYFVTSVVCMIFWGLAFITSIFMMVGVHEDMKGMLIPYIVIKVLIIVVQFIALIIYVIQLAQAFYWVNLVVVLVLMLIIGLNIMCFLCVVSQYQELKAGRGMGV